MSKSNVVMHHSKLAIEDDDDNNNNNKQSVDHIVLFDSHSLGHQETLPNQFIWSSKNEAPKPQSIISSSRGNLEEPLVDLEGFFNGNEQSIGESVELIRKACSSHGFFQVINHGVDMELIREIYKHMDGFFGLPVEEKARLQKKPGEMCGYSGAHADRYSSKLPWKELFSFVYRFGTSTTSFGDDDHVLLHYYKSVFGSTNGFENASVIYQKFCQAMDQLSLAIFELLGISLGVERMHFKQFYEDGNAFVRFNNYPTCKTPSLTFGTGPHCDPNSLTILHQDQVGGLEVFADNKWLGVEPRLDALVVNIGDTFMAHSNGLYKSCLHRVVVNRDKARRSLIFFVNPREDKLIKPPKELVLLDPEKGEEIRRFPDFKWLDMLVFTQRHYRVDTATLESFVQWMSDDENNNN